MSNSLFPYFPLIYSHHHLPLLSPFSPSQFSSFPLISPPFLFSKPTSYSPFYFFPIPFFSQSLSSFSISPFTWSVSLIVPNNAQKLPLPPLVPFLAFTFHSPSIFPHSPSLLAQYPCFPYLSFVSLYFQLHILTHSPVMPPLFSLILAWLSLLVLPSTCGNLGGHVKFRSTNQP